MTAAQMETARKQQEASEKAAELKQMINTLEKVDDEGRRTSLLDTLCSTGDILNLPLHPNPPGIKNGDLVVDLLKHQVREPCRRFIYYSYNQLDQSQALQWCIEREYPTLPKSEADKPVQFWQFKKSGAQVFPSSSKLHPYSEIHPDRRIITTVSTIRFLAILPQYWSIV